MDEFNRIEKCTVFDKFDSCNTTYQVATDDWITINNQDNQSFFFFGNVKRIHFYGSNLAEEIPFQIEVNLASSEITVSWDAFSL